MENTYAEYQQWLVSENLERDKSIEDGYNKALNKLQKIQVFENNLVSVFLLLSKFFNIFSFRIKFIYIFVCVCVCV